MIMVEESSDLISSLPNELLQLIVSLIPLKDSVRTSILSTVWKNLWTPYRVNLDFDSHPITSHEAAEKLEDIIRIFARSYDNPQLLKVFVNNELIFSATKRVNKELHIDFSQGKQVKMNSNFNLILEPVHYNTSSCINSRPLKTPTFSSLTTLRLRSVTHLTENLVSAIFSNSSVLESLTLEKCGALKDIDIKANSYLRNLVVMDCPNLVNIKVSAPNLKSFWYQGVLPMIQLKTTPDLVDVKLNLRDGLGGVNNNFDCEDVLYILKALEDIEILTISGWLLEWLCTAGVIFGRLDFQFTKLKELWLIDCPMDTQNRDSIACFLNITPFLEKLFIDIDQSFIHTPFPFFHQFWHEPHLWMDFDTVKSNAVKLEHLKLVKMTGSKNEENQLLLIDLLLHKTSVTIKKMPVTSPENYSWRGLLRFLGVS